MARWKLDVTDFTCADVAARGAAITEFKAACRKALRAGVSADLLQKAFNVAIVENVQEEDNGPPSS